MTTFRYGWQVGSLPQSCGYITPVVISLLATMRPRKILDLGCGNGALCRELDRRGFFVVGAEPSLDGLEAATELCPSLKFFNVGVGDDPFDIISSEGLFDAVISTEVVEHLYAPHLLPAFAVRCLEPGGVLILTTPYHGYLKNLALALLGKWDHHHTALWSGGHIKFWSRKTLARLLEDNGFCVESFHGVGRLPWLWKSMILVARKKADL
jgi:2-polyprenyl-3-methyl-5-hydroxy-6-metoxy-1,4-benzoquinol methylase